MTLWDDLNGRTCRVCGCTQDKACTDPTFGVCWWVEPDLCSHCVMKERQGIALLWGINFGIIGTLLVGLIVWKVHHA